MPCVQVSDVDARGEPERLAIRSHLDDITRFAHRPQQTVVYDLRVGFPIRCLRDALDQAVRELHEVNIGLQSLGEPFPGDTGANDHRVRFEPSIFDQATLCPVFQSWR